MKMFNRLLCAALLVSLLLSFAACGKQAAGDTSIEGTYYLSSITYADGTTVSGDALRIEQEEMWGMTLTDSYVELYADGTGVICVYGFPQDIGYQDGYFWYSEFLMEDFYIEDEVVVEEIVSEDGEIIEVITPTETTEATEATIPEDLRMPYTISGNKITLDPDGYGDVMTFTKV